MTERRINVRLYPDAADDALAIEWLDGLPNRRGEIRRHLVKLLAREALKEREKTRKKSKSSRNGNGRATKERAVKRVKEPLPEVPQFEDPEEAGANMPKEKEPVQLPNYGA